MNAPVRTPTTAVALTVNGRAVSAQVEPRTHLADFLREGLDLTGAHLGCEHGVCGACTVMLDGEPARGCLSLAAACHGADVVTIEGLDDDEVTAELRSAFNREHALQCGFCTPGMLVSARDLVLRLPEADERRVRLGLSGNLCRCTGYVGIVRAIMGVIADRRTRGVAAAPSVRGIGPVGSRQPNEARLIPPQAELGEGGPSPSEGSGGAFLRPTQSSIRADPHPTPLRGATLPFEMGGIRPALETTTSATADDLSASFTPAHSFSQNFDVAFPPDQVFAFFARIEDVAACLPGAVVTASPSPDRVEGGMRVRLGPIAATFRGVAAVSRDETARSGRIRGAGADGRSSTQGRIDYRVRPGATEGSARIELDVGYALKGPLAQFGRPGLVRDVAGRLVAEFAANLEARLAGAPASAAPARELDPLHLVIGLLRARLSAWIARFRPHGGAPPGGA